ncbi:HVA1 family protein [Streptomyces olindensis]|uniref:HVA1 family protein n=1 Tax=Streptomyces olindensis TaxID=358823 RepID=UPI003F4D6A4C
MRGEGRRRTLEGQHTSARGSTGMANDHGKGGTPKKDDPQYQVRSAKSGKTAVHKPSALKKK